jgi:short-subunit dehydrogenase
MASIKLKPLNEQVIVITGASSGIGLCTAESAARQGAKVILVARSGETLDQIVATINGDGGTAIAVAGDVSKRQDMDNVAARAIDRFGRIDTWVNDAGLAIYGRLEETPEADARRLFDVNYWGVVNGSLAALPHLRAIGGALINVGSEVSDAAVPILGHYAASKHAVKGFTDSLRIEVERIDKAPISITLIQPTAVDTPFDDHGRNLMDHAANLPTPMIDPQDVADAILKAAVKPTPNIKVGTMAKVNTFVAKNAPSVGERMAARQAPSFQRDDEPNTDPEGILNRSSEDAGTAGQKRGRHAKS